MRIEIKKMANFRLLALSGEIIAEDSEQLKKELMASNDDQCVLIDLSKVSKIDPLCMSILYAAYERSKELKNRMLFSV